jgi:hypothetical protein
MRLAVLLLLLLGAGVADARSEGRTLGYPRDQVWSTVVRFVAVDERAKIVDKDPDAGYVLFELEDRGTKLRGSLEIVTVVIDDHPHVKFVLDLRDGPLWREVGMLNRLEQKLRKDLGSPPPPRPRAPKPEPQPEPPADKPQDDGADRR